MAKVYIYSYAIFIKYAIQLLWFLLAAFTKADYCPHYWFGFFMPWSVHPSGKGGAQIFLLYLRTLLYVCVNTSFKVRLNWGSILFFKVLIFFMLYLFRTKEIVFIVSNEFLLCSHLSSLVCVNLKQEKPTVWLGLFSLNYRCSLGLR